jgi:iron-sulfur cluster assembly accessory protein
MVELPTVQADGKSDIENSSVVTVTPVAVAKFREFLDASPSSHIRVHVMSGGCNGFLYKLEIEDNPIDPTDRVDRSNGFTIVMSKKYALILEGTTIDWETQSDGSEGFKFHNPIDRE